MRKRVNETTLLKFLAISTTEEKKSLSIFPGVSDASLRLEVHVPITINVSQVSL